MRDTEFEWLCRDIRRAMKTLADLQAKHRAETGRDYVMPAYLNTWAEREAKRQMERDEGKKPHAKPSRPSSYDMRDDGTRIV